MIHVDVKAARDHPGVATVWTARDLPPVSAKPLVFQPVGLQRPPHRPLAEDAVRYVGQPVVVVAAADRYLARDAAEMIRVEYDPLLAVIDAERALSPGAPRVHPSLPSNLAFEHSWQQGDLDTAFRTAAHVVRARLAHQRLAAIPLEARGCLALYEGQHLTVWLSTQTPHWIRTDLAGILAVPEHRIRVIAPEVGGGFGVKCGIYDDELLTILLAMHLGRPVKWVEMRGESLLATVHGRGQIHDAEMAVTADGGFLGLRVTGVCDLGAYPEASTPHPPLLTGRLITGAYRIPAASYAIRAAYTNKTPTAAYRGAGRPEAAYLIERLADVAARELRLDPAEIRRRNFIRDDEFPYRTPSGLVYDTGRYAFTLDRALEVAGYPRLLAEQAAARHHGRLVGIGLSAFVETAGTGPSRLLPIPGWEYGAVRVEPTGRVTVLTGVSPHGQGQETTFAQIVADALGVALDDVTVLHGDTATVPAGRGTFGSRGTCVGGSAVCIATGRVRDKARRIAAHLLEAGIEDVVFEDGRLFVRGTATRAVAFRDVAATAHRGQNLPPDLEPGLEAASTWDPPEFTVPFGVYVALVEVLRETGDVRVLRFIGVDDVGNVLSPLLLEGQLHGGIAQGIAQALWEEVVHDENGQCATGTLMDYAVPKAGDLPSFELDRTVTPTPVNPLGAKGAGEAGAVGAPAAIVNAVLDALAPFEIRTLDMPLRSERIWTALHARTS